MRVASGGERSKVMTLPRLQSQAMDKEIVQLELNSRIRDLETMMIDFKANIERRIQQSLEDNPQKWVQQFRQLEEKET